MKKFLIITILAIVIAFPFSSCEDFLEPEVHDFVTPEILFQDLDGAKAALAAIYVRKATSSSRSGLGRSTWDVYEKLGPALNGYRTRQYEAWNFTATDGGINNMWVQPYVSIGRQNSAIDMMEMMEPTDIERPAGYNLLERMMAEARFFRAYTYYRLVGMFGEVPLRKRAITSPEDPDLYLPRASGADVYNFILEDLAYAENRLPQATEYGPNDVGRINRGAVQLLAAKVHLQRANTEWAETGDWQAASDYCEKIFNAGIHGLADHQHDLWYFNNPAANKNYAANNWEVMWAYQKDARVHSTPHLIDRGFAPSICVVPDMRWQEFLLDYNFYLSFHPDDTRGHHGSLWKECVASNGELVRFHIDSVGINRWSTNLPSVVKWVDPTFVFPIAHANYNLFRFADVLLMYAEAQNQINNGPNATAYNAVNQVRRRAFQVDDDSYDLQPGLSKSEFIEALYYERLWELHSELWGLYDMYRFWDVAKAMVEKSSRTQLPPNFTGGFGVPRWEVNLEDYHRKLPIPQAQINRNPKLEQNPGW